MLKNNECNEKDLADLAIGKKSVYFEKTICDMARIFTAIKLSDDFKQSLGELQNELRNRGVGGYYAQYQNLHLTLTFIGNILEEQLVSVQKAVSEVKFEPFEICTAHMGFFNNYRRIFLHDLLLNRFAEKQILLGCCNPLQVYRNSYGGQTVLALLNPTHDTYPELRFFAPGLESSDAALLGKDGVWREAKLALRNDGSLIYSGTLAPLEACVLKFHL